MKYAGTLLLVSVLVLFISCQHLTYTPRSKRQQQVAKPSVVLIDRIVDFREKYNAWPFSKEEFIYKDSKYKEAFEGFPYLNTHFNVIDNDKMTFVFTQHRKDVQLYEQSRKTDLNALGGEVRFYKEKDKFIWKIKMY